MASKRYSKNTADRPVQVGSDRRNLSTRIRTLGHPVPMSGSIQRAIGAWLDHISTFGKPRHYNLGSFSLKSVEETSRLFLEPSCRSWPIKPPVAQVKLLHPCAVISLLESGKPHAAIA